MKKQHFHRLEKKSEIYHSIIRFHVFDDYRARTINEMVALIKKYEGVLRSYLYYLQVSSDKINKKYGFTSDAFKVIRGVDSYGYESEQSIKNTLFYIADRFSADLRIQWLLDLPEEIKKLG